MYDLIIIGAGPAGMTAGIYAARREMKVLIISKDVGGQMLWANEIENFPGFKSVVSFDLITKMKDQAASFGVEFKDGEVSQIEKQADGTFKIHTIREVFEAKTVIAAIGLSPRRLAIPGEEAFSGKGVSYCANCDGPFYKNKVVAVVGGGNAALDAAEVLSKMASKVYLIHRNEHFKAFEALIEEVKARENIELVLNSEIKEILGTNVMEKIKVLNSQTNTETELEVNGLFIEVGRLANTDIVADLADRDAANQIIIDKNCATKTPGLFAAGDSTDIDFKQITVACGQGTIAALSAYKYIQGGNIKVRTVK